MAGYSGTPLDKKLGIRPGHRVLVEGGTLPIEVPLVATGPLDVAVVYVTERAQLEAAWERITSMLVAAGALFVG